MSCVIFNVAQQITNQLIMHFCLNIVLHEINYNILSYDSDQVPVGDVIAVDQKWCNELDNYCLIIDKVSRANSTFTGIYIMPEARDGLVDWFLFRGVYDPQGIAIGWVVSYNCLNHYWNYHSVDVWSGYLRLSTDRVPKWTFSAARMSTSNNYNVNVTTAHDVFVLEESN